MVDSHDIQADLVIALQTLDINSFKEILQSPEVDLLRLHDQNNSNIFHEFSKSVIREKLLIEFLEIVISFFYKRYDENASEKLKLLINEATKDEKFTPLHLAIKSGKLVRFIKKLAKEYIRIGADSRVKTQKLQNLCHLASIQGSLPVLTYLKYEVGIEINEKDDKGMNALHLAAKAGNEYTLLSLIAWGCDIHLQDSEKNTPLHYAAMNGNYKIVRNLLQAGADRKSENSSNETPYKIAINNANQDILQILVRTTKKTPGIFARINPFKHPIKPVKNSYKLYAFFVMIYILRYILVLLYIIPHLDVSFQMVSLLIFLLSTISFMMVSHSDPGFLKYNKKESMMFLYQTYQAEFLCPFCETKKPPKARHCPYCNRCVKVKLNQKYDHHCPWIRNCIGKNNHRLFIFFITTISIDFLYNATVGILDYLKILGRKNDFLLNVNNYYPEVALTVSIISLLSFFFTFPVCLIQLTNALKNTTTHERFAYSKERSTESSMPSMVYLRSSDENAGPDLGLSLASSYKKKKLCDCFGSRKEKRQISMVG